MKSNVKQLAENIALRLVKSSREHEITLRELFGEDLVSAESFSWQQHDLIRTIWERTRQSGWHLCPACDYPEDQNLLDVPLLLKRTEESQIAPTQITSITFSRSCYFDGSKTVHIKGIGDGAVAEFGYFPSRRYWGQESPDMLLAPVEWDALRKGVAEANVGTWCPEYIDISVCDGLRWSIEIGLANGSSISSFGINAYPLEYDDMLQALSWKGYSAVKDNFGQ